MSPVSSESHLRSLFDRALASGVNSLDECESKQLLLAYGVPVPEGELVQTEAAAVEAAQRLKSPVALKVVGRTIHHKSDRQLIALNVEGSRDVRSAYRRLVGLAAADDHAVLVEQMLRGPRELMIGMKRDAYFGPVVLFGVGGVFAEAHRDFSLAVCPLDDGDVERMFSGMRARSLLGGIRGLPAVDLDACAAAIRAMELIAADFPEVAEIDVNPLMIEGARPVAADALVILSAGDGESADPVCARPSACLDAVFRPRSVAIVGASDNLAKWGGSLLEGVIAGGYPGDVYPVNRRGGRIQRLPAYPSLEETPSTPDLVIVALGADHVEDVIDDCLDREVPAAVVVTAGFSETGSEGAAVEEAIVTKAKRGNLTLVGPNCNGLFSSEGRLHAVGFLPVYPEPGRISIVSQSGTVGTQVLVEAARRGIGIEKYVAIGNGATTSVLDVLEVLGEDPQTAATIVYLEGVEDGARFQQVMRRVTQRKPVVVVRGGLTLPGSRAAASHTGAIAGSAEVFLAAAKQSGCLIRLDPDEALDLALCLAHLPAPDGPRVAVLTFGGGWGVLITDELVRCGLRVPVLPPNVVSGLDELLPTYWSHANPVDMVSSGDAHNSKGALRVLAESDAFDAIIVLTHLIGRGLTYRWSDQQRDARKEEEDFLELVRDVMGESGKPVICVPMDVVDRALFESGRGEASPVVLPTPFRAARALGGLVEYWCGNIGP